QIFLHYLFPELMLLAGIGLCQAPGIFFFDVFRCRGFLGTPEPAEAIGHKFVFHVSAVSSATNPRASGKGACFSSRPCFSGFWSKAGRAECRRRVRAKPGR